MLTGLSIFRCGNENSVHGRPSWELLRPDAEHPKLPKILPHGANLLQRNAASMSAPESAEHRKGKL